MACGGGIKEPNLTNPLCGLILSLCALSLLIVACQQDRKPALQAVYQDALNLLLTEHFQKASEQVGRGLALAPPGSKIYWDFRLLRVQILLARRETIAAGKALEQAPPNLPEFSETIARYRLFQAHAALISHNPAEARTRLDQAQALASNLHRERLFAEIALRRALLEVATRDFNLARSLLLGIVNARYDDDLRIAAMNQLGWALSHDGRCDEALSWFRKAATLARAAGLKASEARAVGNLGYCFFQLGDLDKALPSLREAEATFDSAGMPYDRQIFLGNIGNIEENNQDRDAAAADYGKALAISKSLRDEYWSAVWLDDLAFLSIEREDWDAAESYNSQALASKRRIKDEESVDYSLVNEGLIENGRTRYRSAQEIFEGFLRKSHQDVRLVLDAHAGLGEAFAGQHRDAPALNQFQQALTVMGRQQAALADESEKLTWFASVIRVYREYVDFLMARGKTLDALEVVQSARGRLLASRLGQTNPRERCTSGELQRLAARSGSTLLVYFAGTQKSYAWAISAKGIRNYELPAEADLRRLIGSYDSFVQQLHDPMSEENASGKTLYDELIAPAHLTSTKVILAPDGPLYSLNFATLPVNSTKRGGRHYWIEDVQLSIAPSFELFPGGQPRQKPSLLMIGDPVSADAEYPELPFARQEMSAIQEHLSNVRQVKYAGAEARPASYVQGSPGGFSWIHFVAHATANQDEPLQSAVILSRSSGSEYRLFARDVLRIPLRADVVTLSACQGAGAKVYAGEGLVGFSWAFLKAGARNVVAGLWDVNDRSTAQLMASLYGELGGGASASQALRTAQLRMLRGHNVFRKPYYWGPFEVFGATE